MAAEDGGAFPGHERGSGGYVKFTNSVRDGDVHFTAEGRTVYGRSAAEAHRALRPTGSPGPVLGAAAVRSEAVLPPLECRGRLVAPPEGFDGYGGGSAAAADGCGPRGVLASGGRSRSPPLAGMPGGSQPYMLRPEDEAPGLVISGLGGGRSLGKLIAASQGRPSGGSLLLPPSVAAGFEGQLAGSEGPSPPGHRGSPVKAPRAPVGPAPRAPRLAKGSPGSTSMPVLSAGPPRLLVQGLG
eukprot:SRR837773.24803.p1 GENE.SRR837773.24803~~SRR837773.24803.p1  ORF type:complete len:277 (-),score=3.24 SRR837773.24803:42-764(-)